LFGVLNVANRCRRLPSSLVLLIGACLRERSVFPSPVPSNDYMTSSPTLCYLL
jgi:hypothetical protein